MKVGVDYVNGVIVVEIEAKGGSSISTSLKPLLARQIAGLLDDCADNLDQFFEAAKEKAES